MKFIASSFISTVILITIIMLAAGSSPAEEKDPGRVYIMTNHQQDNTIIVFSRAGNGMLTRLEEISTGGLGAGFGTLPAFLPPAPGPNPLQSQDGLVFAEDGRFLLAVNAGSNDLSVMAVTGDGLQLVSKAATGGLFPVSIAIHSDLVYVLNEGDNTAESLGGIPNITGFRLDKEGNLNPIPGSTRTAGTNPSHPADIVFNPEGDALVVTEKFTDLIDIFFLDAEGRPAQKNSMRPNAPTPFGIAFGKHGILTITETNSFLEDGRRNAVAGGSSMSSYYLSDQGELRAISESIPNHQTAVCWVRFTPNGRFAYTSNKGSGTISSFLVSPEGELTLLKEVAADTGGTLSGPIDLAISRDGRFLYVIASFVRSLRSYRIEEDGSLTPLQVIEDLPLTVQGIVAH